ncbi:MAG: membrane-bound lytic murein transglycosylase MltF [Gammaproteobacteria bacterium HGW-Gammaproteobacteria-6]|nr:MAG: membrane-bound lytic murein transglycosylase MltF [Gammaproteobacteria bacterium HGW-Gammaproteobacteria-6]
MVRVLNGIVLIVACALTACSDSNRLGHPDQTGVLKVVTRSGSTTYYNNRDNRPTGPEYDLVNRFARAHGWSVEWDVQHSTANVLAQLEQGNAHLGAAGLTLLESRSSTLLAGPAHKEITQQVVCHRDHPALPRHVEQLQGIALHVAAQSSYAESLRQLEARYPQLVFTEHADLGTEQLLLNALEGEIECVVADSNIVQVNRRFMPELEVAMDLTDTQQIGWYLPPGSRKLARQARDWMATAAGQEAINRVESSYYAYIGEFDFVDLRALNRRIHERLPQFKEQFLRAEQETRMPADLLAAVAYQESHWNPHARSPTGVRGLMMLTQRTARELGVANRLDPVQSIQGGARYLADRHQRLPDSVPEPDRTFMALASYNIGRGHLLDARRLARELGKNPDSWVELREVLPLLADERYYPSLRYGYARGYEPVHYVRQIRNYRDVIAQAFE